MSRRTLVIGLDGFDPVRADRMFRDGRLPHLRRLAEAGGWCPVRTTAPAQTPVAWSTVAVGANPGAHGIFDFLRRDPETYRTEVALFGVERRNAFLPPRVVNRRRGDPVWKILGDAGVPSTVLRHPCTFPPDRMRGRILAGVGVPDLRGRFGASAVFSTDPDVDGEDVRALVPGPDGTLHGRLPGPRGSDGEPVEIELEVDPDADGRRVRVTLGGKQTEVLEAGRWGPWIDVRFKTGRLQRVRGRVRFHLVSARDPTVVYASPLNPDPYEPVTPISDPWDYARELDEALGPYHTLGMAEDHSALDSGTLDEDTFLAQCGTVLDERRAMLLHELERFDEGLLFCVVDTPDRIQHMLWRHGEPDHPANAVHGHEPERAVLLDEHYDVCDRLVGEAVEAAGGDTLVMVLSDHGFTSFRRQIDLNAWLRDQGLLVPRAGADEAELEEGVSDAVDWERSRAWAVGMAGIYLNLEGREARGIVSGAEAPGLAAEIAGALTRLRDPEDGSAPPVRRAQPGSEIYRGEYRSDAPDVVVGCAPGWRIGSRSAMGGMGREVFSDNTRRWSGDHVVDPASVPGFFAMNRSFDAEGLALADVAPTILASLDVPPGAAMEGRSVM